MDIKLHKVLELHNSLNICKKGLTLLRLCFYLNSDTQLICISRFIHHFVFIILLIATSDHIAKDTKTEKKSEACSLSQETACEIKGEKKTVTSEIQ